MHYQDFIEKLKKYSSNKKLRYSKEREFILKVIIDLNYHFDAQELFVILKKNEIKTSRATVFRTLLLFKDAGILKMSDFGEKHYHYELVKDSNHYHLICVNCSKVVEFNEPDILEKNRITSEKNGFKYIDSKFEIYGICEECK